MSFISFFVHICGMTNKVFSEKIMIDMPMKSVEFFYDLDNENVPRINDTISKTMSFIVEREHDLLTTFDGSCLERLCYNNVYIEYEGYFFGFKDDIKLEVLFELFNTDHIKLHYFHVVGGASRTYLGYRFVIHPDEYVHRNEEPHVHVEKEGKSPRYSLKTFKMFDGDNYSREHIRDKKRIKKHLKDNKEWYLNNWNFYMRGLIPPTETIEGKQLLQES